MTVLAPSKPRVPAAAPHAYVVPVVREITPRRAEFAARSTW
jgi:hypothetical protein